MSPRFILAIASIWLASYNSSVVITMGYLPSKLVQLSKMDTFYTSWYLAGSLHQKYAKSLGKTSLFTGEKVYDSDSLFVLQKSKKSLCLKKIESENRVSRFQQQAIWTRYLFYNLNLPHEKELFHFRYFIFNINRSAQSLN